jgi:hypothetical protein
MKIKPTKLILIASLAAVVCMFSAQGNPAVAAAVPGPETPGFSAGDASESVRQDGYHKNKKKKKAPKKGGGKKKAK